MKNDALENRIKRLEKQNSDGKTILKIFNEWIENPWIYRNTRFIIFVSALVLFYIVHTRNAEKVCSQISEFKSENKQLRWEYLFKKSEAEKFGRKNKLNNLLERKNLTLSNIDDLPQKLRAK